MEYNKETNTCPEPAGILVIIGGKEDKGDKPEDKNKTREEVLKGFIELIEKDNPRIEVVTSGSSEGDEMFEDYRKVFEEMKVKNTGHIHHKLRKDVLNDDDIIERVNKADAFFLTGGDQLLLTSLYLCAKKMAASLRVDRTVSLSSIFQILPYAPLLPIALLQ